MMIITGFDLFLTAADVKGCRLRQWHDPRGRPLPDDPDVRYCGECGRSIDVKKNVTTCPNCRAIVPMAPGMVFCGNCGNPIGGSTAMVSCPHCRAAVPWDPAILFCRVCGGRLS